MKELIDREKELASLERAYTVDQASLVVIYGRRRTGKTTLISEFIRDKNALYFLASAESDYQNLQMFTKVATDFLDKPFDSVSKWDDVFQEIIRHPHREKPVIVIDEFQYLGQANPAFPSIFQRIWDLWLQKSSVMVILCGSLISMMLTQTLNYSSPLYGRRTGQIRLRQIPFRYYEKFFSGLSRRDLVERYSITGGIPKYIEFLNSHSSIQDMVHVDIFDNGGRLYEEPIFLLSQEVKEVGNALMVLRTVASGNHTPAKIASRLKFTQEQVEECAKILLDLDILRREVPVTEYNEFRSKLVNYRIKDNFLAFWFRFVPPNLSSLESGNVDVAFRQFDSEFISKHVSYVYEDICRQELIFKDLPISIGRIGRWWDNKDHEIDIVALNENEQQILFGECKYRNKLVGVDVLHGLEHKSQFVTWNKGTRKEFFALFSISGFTDELQQLAVERDDLFLFE